MSFVKRVFKVGIPWHRRSLYVGHQACALYPSFGKVASRQASSTYAQQKSWPINARRSFFTTSSQDQRPINDPLDTEIFGELWHEDCPTCKIILGMTDEQRLFLQHHDVCRSLMMVINYLFMGLAKILNDKKVLVVDIPPASLPERFMWLCRLMMDNWPRVFPQDDPHCSSKLESWKAELDAAFKLCNQFLPMNPYCMAGNLNCDDYELHLVTLRRLARLLGLSPVIILCDRLLFHHERKFPSTVRSLKRLAWRRTYHYIRHPPGSDLTGELMLERLEEPWMTDVKFTYPCHRDD